MIAVSPLVKALVRRRTQAFMTTPVSILRGTQGALDPVTGTVGGMVVTTVVYTGKARVHTVSGEGSIAVGEGEINTRQVIISIPVAAPVPRQNDLVVITSGDDTDLTGAAWQIREVSGGSLFDDARRLSCVGFHGNRFWGGP